MKEIPRWLYSSLWVLALLVGAAQFTLLGKVSWLKHDTDSEYMFNFIAFSLAMAGFGTVMKRGSTVTMDKDKPDA